MKKTFTLFILSFLMAFSVFAQQDRNCSTMQNLEYRQQLDPTLQQRMDQIEAYTQQRIAEAQNARIDGSIITIPVVVHVIYSNSNENISEAQILSQIQVLNDDFRRTNADANNTWSQAADTEIQFCMATVDPNGNATNGITRKSSTRTSWGTNDDMKKSSQGGVDPWDTSQYLNMWVCNIGGGILGYAQFPGGSAATDGVVMGPQYFGSKNGGSGFYLSAPFDLGRTTTHEVGHFLNLRHIWGDGNCNADDFVSDTPTSDAANYGCATGHVSCGTTDMVQNYMDYSDDSCMNLYTQGQKARMRAVLLPGGVRASLGASTKCDGGGSTPTCTDGIQNGDETGVDCGGSSCSPCQTACNDNDVNVTITFDNYPEETAWTIKNSSGTTVASGGTYGSQPDGSTISETLCLPDGCYDFTITDAYGDGICCSYGNGSYSVTNGSTTLASGGSFASSEVTNFCVGSAPADTVKPVITLNGNATINLTVGDTYNEQGATATDDVDGNLTSSIVITGTVNTNSAGTYTRFYNVSDAAGNAADQVTRTVVVSPATSGCTGGVSSFPYSEGFESSFGLWTQGSGDDFNWTRRSGSTPSSNTGPSSAAAGSQYAYMESSAPNYSNKRAILVSPCFDLSGVNNANFSFKYHMYGSSAMGSLSVAISTNNGSSWTTIWSRSGNQGNAWQDASVDLSSYSGDAVRLRFDGTTGTTWQGDMAVDAISLTNGAADKCAGVSPWSSGTSYSTGDQVTYNGYLYERTNSGWVNLGPCGTARIDNQGFVQHLGVAISVYPNPVKGNTLFVKTNVENLPYTVVNMLGQQVAKGITTSKGINVSQLEAGLYLVQFEVNDTIETRKFLKQ
ncbi:immunoglobulin-like domain-containing protein [Olleya aquimaris]|uniref:Putative secreted protein (Por secretion system target) n=1 Tax=Olleya aquimaris TaxID=639310 RepID=A0A327RN88_9FLAO|nr:immunoglobulin-like domain-containing protein [Olleya aquimaris]RAJ17961.1 putative secreted protein (Por secretion system target) [Olleya aquimaris]